MKRQRQRSLHVGAFNQLAAACEKCYMSPLSIYYQIMSKPIHLPTKNSPFNPLPTIRPRVLPAPLLIHAPQQHRHGSRQQHGQDRERIAHLARDVRYKRNGGRAKERGALVGDTEEAKEACFVALSKSVNEFLKKGLPEGTHFWDEFHENGSREGIVRSV